MCHLSSLPWIHVEMKRQQESGQGITLYCAHQSEENIILCQPIRSKYRVVSTNQKWVLYCDNWQPIREDVLPGPTSEWSRCWHRSRARMWLVSGQHTSGSGDWSAQTYPGKYLMVLSLQGLESSHHPSSVIQTKSIGEGESVVEDNVDCQVGPD